jgi:malic enzyme
MQLIIDDTGSRTKLKIMRGKKVILKRSGTIKQLLKFVYENTSKEKVKEAIMELQPMYQFMIGSKFKTTIKE